MAQQIINIGTAPNDGSGDPLRSAIIKINENFSEVYVAEPLGVGAAAAGSVYVADGLGSGTWINTTATNEIIVNSMANFPDPISGEIFLDANTRYVISSPISTSDRFILGANTQITSFNTLSPVFEYTGTGTMFTGIDVTGIIQDVRLNAPNGEVFNFSDVAVANTNICLIKDVLINSATKFGTFDSLISLVITDTSCFNAADGITLAGSGWRVWRFQDIGMLTTNSTFVGIDLTAASCAGILFQTSLFTMTDPGGIALKGMADSGNVPEGSLGRVSNMNLPALGTAISGITVDDTRWSFFDNDAIPDTMPDAFIYLTGNTTPTVISDTGVPVLVAGVWVEQEVSQFIITPEGRIIFKGERPIKAPILASLSCIMASGNDTNVTFSLYRNGVQIPGSEQSNTVKATATGNTSLMWQEVIQPDAYYEIYVANEESTTNVIVQDAKFLIN